MSEEDKNKKTKDKEKNTTVYFDGDCPMCRTFVPWLDNGAPEKKEESGSVKFEDLRTEALPDGITKNQAIEKIHLLDKDGEILTGAKAVLTAMEQNNKFPLFVKFGRLPVIKDLAEIVYTHIANNRFLIFGDVARAYWIKLVLCFALLIPLIITRNLWLGSCVYPFTPIFDFLPELPTFINYTLYLSIFIITALIFIKKEPKIYIYSLLGILAFSSLFNISRLQPYNYQFFFMFLALAGFNWLKNEKENSDQKRLLSVFAIILIGIWFWSGVHKLNYKFFTVGYPWLISVFPEYLKPLLGMLGLFSTVVEAGGAICLIFKKTRKLGIALLSIMHVFLLLVVILHNNNHSVISWNIAQILFLWLVFWKSDLEINLFKLGSFKADSLKTQNLLYKSLFIILPLFSYVGLWNDTLSFKLYSWNYKEGEIIVLARKIPKNLPEEMTANIKRNIIPIQTWSYQATNSSPFYSEKVYKSVFKKACKINKNLQLVISERPNIQSIISKRHKYRCNEQT